MSAPTPKFLRSTTATRPTYMVTLAGRRIGYAFKTEEGIWELRDRNGTFAHEPTLADVRSVFLRRVRQAQEFLALID